ncbi:MAG: TetR/AcrR family transcriptional regulator [Nevskia sp.]|nr:TetR/AcrR family transcriptional regulator [Nevskia sp.]
MSTEAREQAAAPRRPRAARAAGKTVRKRRSQAERSEDMRLRLVEAAASILRRKGYAGLRTAEVSKVARVSRGAQLHHFPTKDSLVLATAAHLLQSSLARGVVRARNTAAADDPIEAIEAVIQDSLDFFLGEDFAVILDLVLTGTKAGSLRGRVFEYARENRLGVEQAWLDVLVRHGLAPERARKILWLTISIVRGLSVRALWQRDEALFRELLDEWKLILAGHLKQLDGERHDAVA